MVNFQSCRLSCAIQSKPVLSHLWRHKRECKLLLTLFKVEHKTLNLAGDIIQYIPIAKINELALSANVNYF